MFTKVTILILLLTTFLFAQYDTVFVEINADTAEVWNTLVEENCAFAVEFIVEINGDIITIVEHDTVTEQASCSCIYDLCVKLKNLESNDYTVNVYRQYSVEYYNTDSLYYIGTAYFSYNKTSVDTVNKKYYQSECYHPQSLNKKETIPSELFLLSSYPNPFNPETTIELYIPEKSKVKLKLYDMSGKLIKIITSATLSRGNYIYNLNAGNYSSGSYLLLLESDNKLVKSKKIVLLK